jgi:hypothetical protein
MLRSALRWCHLNRLTGACLILELKNPKQRETLPQSQLVKCATTECAYTGYRITGYETGNTGDIIHIFWQHVNGQLYEACPAILVYVRFIV